MKRFEAYAGISPLTQSMYAWGGCYPGKVTKACINGQRVEGIHFHFRWNMDEMDNILESGTIRFTSVREPFDMFRSAFNYYYYEHRNRIQAKCGTCMRVPFAQIAGGRNDMPLDEFIDILPDKFNATMPLNYRVKNWQAFEMGMDHLNDDPDYVRQSLATLDRQFELVIVTEYYYESMVLLAQLLCAPYEVLWMKIRNPRAYAKPLVRPENIDKFNKHFAVDIAVYEHFKRVLIQKIDIFGQMRMAEEVSKMKEIFNGCNKNKQLCDFMTKPIVTQPIQPDVKPSLQYYIDQVESGYGNCPYRNSPYQMIKRYIKTGELTSFDCVDWCDLHRAFIEDNFRMPQSQQRNQLTNLIRTTSRQAYCKLFFNEANAMHDLYS